MKCQGTWISIGGYGDDVHYDVPNHPCLNEAGEDGWCDHHRPCLCGDWMTEPGAALCEFCLEKSK